MCNGCFGLLSKIKKGSAASFWCIFSAWFFYKNVLYLILNQWRKFQCNTLFLYQDIQQNVLLSSYLDSWWCHKLRFSLNQNLKQWLTGKKRGEDEKQKFENLKNKKFFRSNKKHFSWFLKAYHLVKNKKISRYKLYVCEEDQHAKPCKSLGYIKCSSSSSSRPAKSPSNSTTYNWKKISSWLRRPTTILEIRKKATIL